MANGNAQRNGGDYKDNSSSSHKNNLYSIFEAFIVGDDFITSEKRILAHSS